MTDVDIDKKTWDACFSGPIDGDGRHGHTNTVTGGTLWQWENCVTRENEIGSVRIEKMYQGSKCYGARAVDLATEKEISRWEPQHD